MGERDDSPGREGLFMRAAVAVGDLGSPFYREERQRDVWNEAAAVGLQLALWLGYLVAAAFVWVGGADAVPYAMGVLVLVGAATLVTIAYAQRLGVEVDVCDTSGRRVAVLVAAIVFLAAGFVRAGALSLPSGPPWGDDLWSWIRFSASIGFVFGFLCGVVGFVSDRRARRARQL